MSITAEMVRKLREETGAGMMECKSALVEAGGNSDNARDILRKKGLASAAKKAGRATNDGVIGHRLAADNSSGILVEVNCESDFVARTEDFQNMVAGILDEIERKGDGATEEWVKDPNGPIQQRVAAVIGKLGENMAVPRFVRYAGGGYVAHYVHGPKLAVQVEFSGVTPAIAVRDEFKDVAKKVAQQVAAASPEAPRYVSRAAVPPDVLEKERAIYRAQMENSGKPANVIDKIVEGKLGSFFSLVVLPDQVSIHDSKQTVADVINAASKTLGASIGINRFARLKVGETA